MWPASFGTKRLWSEKEDEWYEMLKERYDSWHSSEEKRIPRIIHQIWLGPLPFPFVEFSQKLRELHPQWEYRLWRDEDLLEIVDESFHERLKAAKNFGEKSDVARYEILFRFGGVYVDVDFEFFKPLDRLCSSGCFAGFSHVDAIEINNALIGAVPNHPVLAECRKRCKKRPSSVLTVLAQSGFLLSDHEEMLSSDTIQATGPGLFTRVFCELFQINHDTLCLPPDIFYPAPNTTTLPSTQSLASFATSDTLAVHHWACTWQKAHKPASSSFEIRR